MMMKLFFIAFWGLFHLAALSQDSIPATVWEENPVLSTLSPENANENVVGIFIDEKYEFTYNANGKIDATNTVHNKIRVNDEASINDHNTIIISTYDVVEVLDIKARVIKPNGKIVDFDSTSIKETSYDDADYTYTIFAIDGIEKGDDIEYYIKTKILSTDYGRCYFQFDYPIQRGSFEIISSKKLLYDVRGYNGFPIASHAILDDERNKYTCELENIAAIKEEKFAHTQSRKARIDFRLDYNLYRSQFQRNTWDDAAQKIRSNVYLNVDEKDLYRWIKSIPVTGKTNLEKATEIEDYLKLNITIDESDNENYNDLQYVYENKTTSEDGFVRIMANVLKVYGIEHQLVLTSKRSRTKFDGTFQSWKNLLYYLIYLPDGDTYIDPSNNDYRMGCVNEELIASDGLFVYLDTVDGFETVGAKVHYIKPTPAEANSSNMNIYLTVDTVNLEALVETTIGLSGLSGGYLKNKLKGIGDEDKQKWLRYLMHQDAPQSGYQKLEILDSSHLKTIENSEFIFHAAYSTPTLIELAADKILLNIGATIGKQTEMYFDKERTASIENEFNRSYGREITVAIPRGYRIKNPQAADMSFVVNDEGKNIFGFVSSHTINDSVYTVSIDEYYHEIYAELKYFEGFKNVVNAAADFNNVVLVLEKR